MYTITIKKKILKKKIYIYIGYVYTVYKNLLTRLGSPTLELLISICDLLSVSPSSRLRSSFSTIESEVLGKI